jgi:hypothetical protein
MSESCTDSEVYPDGYAEALADCTVLAAQLLKMALKVTETKTDDPETLRRGGGNGWTYTGRKHIWQQSRNRK